MSERSAIELVSDVQRATELLDKAHGYVQAHANTIGGQRLAEEIKAFVHGQRCDGKCLVCDKAKFSTEEQE